MIRTGPHWLAGRFHDLAVLQPRGSAHTHTVILTSEKRDGVYSACRAVPPYLISGSRLGPLHVTLPPFSWSSNCLLDSTTHPKRSYFFPRVLHVHDHASRFSKNTNALRQKFGSDVLIVYSCEALSRQSNLSPDYHEGLRMECCSNTQPAEV